MTVTVIDDRFDDLFIHEFYKRVNEIPVTQNNVANRYTWPYGNKELTDYKVLKSLPGNFK